jgi:hypothetical protein
VSLPRPLPQPTGESIPEPRRPAVERPAVHLHLHGVSAEDVAEVLRRLQAGSRQSEQHMTSPVEPYLAEPSTD